MTRQLLLTVIVALLLHEHTLETRAFTLPTLRATVVVTITTRAAQRGAFTPTFHHPTTTEEDE